jgi:hypothetical protein
MHEESGDCGRRTPKRFALEATSAFNVPFSPQSRSMRMMSGERDLAEAFVVCGRVAADRT